MSLKSTTIRFMIAGASVLFFAPFLSAQLSSADESQLAALRQELTFTPKQDRAADSLFRTAASDLRKIDSEITTLVRSGIPKEESDMKVSVLNQKKKDVREMRDLELTLLLTPLQKKIYDERIKPAQPQVLHFGLTHDRSTCNVCNK